MSIFDWSTTAGSNGTVDGVNIAEGCPSASINDGIRAVMANVRGAFALPLKNFLAGSVPLPVANGGTGGATQSAARTALGLGGMATQAPGAVAIAGGAISGLSTPLPVDSGGTGAATAAAALAALGGLGVSAFTDGANGSIKLTNGLILNWGTVTAGMDSSGSATFNTPFTSWCIPVVSSTAQSGSSTNSQNTGISSYGLTSVSIWNADDRSVSVPFIAVGK